MNAGQPFGRRSVLALVGIGGCAFLVLLYALGTGFAGGSGNDGGGHALSRGLTGYAALAALLEADGRAVEVSRDPGALRRPGLVILTPPHDADGDELASTVEARRTIGPTLVIAPKWLGAPVGPAAAGARAGWVTLHGAQPPDWIDAFGEDLTLAIAGVERRPARWSANALTARLPAARSVQALHEPAAKDGSRTMLELVSDQDGRMLAGYLNDDGAYPALDRWSGWDPPDEPDEALFPLVVVAEPDLLDNYGMADRTTALGALALVRAAAGGREVPVILDVTLNGLGRARNLLTLAFTPPFLAATLALLLAALAAAWRAFNRFGPPRAAARPLAYGKTALVENSAGLIRRARRLRLLGAPYAALVTARLARALSLPANAPAEAIDAAQARRGLPGARFSETAAALAAARKPHALVRGAGALHDIEKALT
ncbi:MAG TPA: DUF4350 domain-containing protein [Novosphingobium sp.]|nr:DUF4350 domain-containing protein [Novosphingobium sp.]